MKKEKVGKENKPLVNTGNSMFAIGIFYFCINGLGAVFENIGLDNTVQITARVSSVVVFGIVIYLGMKIKNLEIKTKEKLLIIRLSLIPALIGTILVIPAGAFFGILYLVMLIELISLNLKVSFLIDAEA